MKINVSIEANSVEEAQAAFAALAGNAVSTEAIKEAVVVQLEPAKEPEKEVEKPKASRSKPKEAVQADPLGATPAVQAEPVASADPLAGTTSPAAHTGNAVVVDPLGATPAVQADPLATTAPATGDITFEQVRAKIGEVATHSRPKVMALVATYKKADGTPCERPSDLQENDYAVIYTDLDYV
jgi:hypothetical protein